MGWGGEPQDNGSSSFITTNDVSILQSTMEYSSHVLPTPSRMRTGSGVSFPIFSTSPSVDLYPNLSHDIGTIRYTKLGGCHYRLEAGDSLLFAFDAFHKKHFLKLSGPVTTTVGVPITVTVVDGASDIPMSDVFVAGQKTDENGRATVIFRSPGIHSLKAKRSADSIRSDVLRVTVSR